MKYITILAASLFTLTTAFADMTPPNTHHIDRCVQIQDRSDTLGNLSVEGKITGPMVNGEEIKQLSPNTCLDKGYKFNSLEILITDSNGKKHSLGKIETYGKYVDNSNPLTKEEITYSIKKDRESYKLVEIKNITEDHTSNIITKRNIIILISSLFAIAAAIIVIKKKK